MPLVACRICRNCTAQLDTRGVATGGDISVYIPPPKKAVYLRNFHMVFLLLWPRTDAILCHSAPQLKFIPPNKIPVYAPARHYAEIQQIVQRRLRFADDSNGRRTDGGALYYLNINNPRRRSLAHANCTTYEIRFFCFLPTALAREVFRGNAIASVYLSVRLFQLYLLDWPLTLNLCIWVVHDYSRQGIECQSHRSRLRSWVTLMRSVHPRCRAVFLVAAVRGRLNELCCPILY